MGTVMLGPLRVHVQGCLPFLDFILACYTQNGTPLVVKRGSGRNTSLVLKVELWWA